MFSRKWPSSCPGANTWWLISSIIPDCFNDSSIGAAWTPPDCDNVLLIFFSYLIVMGNSHCTDRQQPTATITRSCYITFQELLNVRKLNRCSNSKQHWQFFVLVSYCKAANFKTTYNMNESDLIWVLNRTAFENFQKLFLMHFTLNRT